MTELHTLASGSSGNALLLSRDGTHLLLDAGISCRRITASLRELGVEVSDLDGIFITHAHSDHISGMQTLLKRTAAPVYASARACRELCCRMADAEDRLRPCNDGVTVGGWAVTPFSTSHDSPGSAGFRFDSADGSVGVLTDTGYVTDEARAALAGTDLLVLEANHDVDTLRSGPYPYYLKRRILGSEGHLSNDDAAVFAKEMAAQGTREIVLAHLSRENNTPVMAYDAVARRLAQTDVVVSVAPRDCPGEAHILTGGVLCRR